MAALSAKFNLLPSFSALEYFKHINLWSSLAPLLGKIDICAHWVFCRKLNSEQFLCETFFDIIDILAALSPKANLLHYSRLCSIMLRCFHMVRTWQRVNQFYMNARRTIVSAFLKLFTTFTQGLTEFYSYVTKNYLKICSVCFRHFFRFSLKSFENCPKFYWNYRKILLRILNCFYLIFSRTSLKSENFLKLIEKSKKFSSSFFKTCLIFTFLENFSKFFKNNYSKIFSNVFHILKIFLNSSSIFSKFSTIAS